MILQDVREQICDIYDSDDFWWREKAQERKYLRGYITVLIERGNLFWACDEDERVVGLCETWRVDYDLLGRLLCKMPVILDAEDTESGNIAMVMNVWIDKQCRRSKVFKAMKREWYNRFSDCDYYCGNAQRKSAYLWKCFKKDNLQSDIFKIGV